MPHFKTLSQGFVRRVPNSNPAPIAAGPRAVVAPDGSLVCTYSVQSKLGVNDFATFQSRSTDLGSTWTEEGPLWPDLRNRYSFFLNLSRSRAGELFLFGSRYNIDTPGESAWSDATQGLKFNELVYASSTDSGKTWSRPAEVGFPVRNATSGPTAGSAEQTSPLCVTKNGRWISCYSPYNTFDPNVKVDRHRVVAVMSNDRGDNWSFTSMLRFEQVESGGAEAWVIELADGRLLGTCWHTNLARGDAAKAEYPNAYALSDDGGATWSPTRSTGTLGHTTALTALPDGRALFCYVNRNPRAAIGIWLAIIQPTPADFGIQHQEVIWTVDRATQTKGADAGHDAWTNFNFGEPCITLLPDGTLLLVSWFSQDTHSGVLYQKMKLVN